MYQKMIVRLIGCTETEARLVEGFMRLEHSTLDGLSQSKFKSEAKIGLDCVRQDPKEAELLAKSFGL